MLVDQLAALPADAKSSDLTADSITKGLSSEEKKDFVAFGSYLAQECLPAGTASGAPSAP